jgi:hypothetical protein
MRTTQFIGLNQKAIKYLELFSAVPQKSERFCEGMFEEKLELREWLAVDNDLSDEKFIVREVVQVEYWSSGPMIFTCLEIEPQNGFRILICQWVENPALKLDNTEFDQETGELWI